jgi:4-oxalocrotonate tautomerase
MPFVNVLITRDGATREQKAQVIAEITNTLQRVLGKDPRRTYVVIDEVDTDNWGWAGETTTVTRARQAKQAAPGTES